METKFDAMGYFNKPRFEVMTNYPKPADFDWYEKGDIVGSKNDKILSHYQGYPNIFRPLTWYEFRTTEELMKMRFIEVVKPSYYITGDKVAVACFIWDGLTTVNPKIIGYNCKGHSFMLDGCLPANEEVLLGSHK